MYTCSHTPRALCRRPAPALRCSNGLFLSVGSSTTNKSQGGHHFAPGAWLIFTQVAHSHPGRWATMVFVLIRRASTSPMHRHLSACTQAPWLFVRRSRAHKAIFLRCCSAGTTPRLLYSIWYHCTQSTRAAGSCITQPIAFSGPKKSSIHTTLENRRTSCRTRAYTILSEPLRV
jgi:hypothetical protein